MSQREFKLNVAAGMTFSSVRDHVGVTTVRPGSIDPMTAVVQQVKAFCVLLSFLFHDTTRLNGTLFSYIFYLVISSDSINEKVLMISVHH